MKRGIVVFFLIVFGVHPAPDKHDIRTYIILPQGRVSTDTIIMPEIVDLYAFGAVRRFYESRSFKMAWFKREEMTPSADSLIRSLKHVQHFGLVGEDFDIPVLDSLANLPYRLQTANRLDVLLTDAYFRLTDQVSAGRLNKETLRKRMRNHLPDTVLIAELNLMLRSADPSNVRHNGEPGNLHYQELINRLSSMIKIADAELLSPEERRVRQAEILRLAINIERWKWIQSELPERYLLINIPAYSLTLYEDGKSVLQSKVIVGTKDNATPIIHSVIECFIVYPYWHVPRGIATKELLPLIKKDLTYLAKNRFDVFALSGKLVEPSHIDWLALNPRNFPYSLRQREGPDNALGVLKFQFENPYAVYLHDTNAKKLFGLERRAYSHGCVRVEKAYELAQNLIRYDSTKITPDFLDKVLRSGIQTEIVLRKPLPIFIEYFTADGIKNYEDVYNKDQRLLASFAGMFPAASDLSDDQLKLRVSAWTSTMQEE